MQETNEERADRLRDERKRKKANADAAGAMAVAALPSASLLAIGYEWAAFSAGMAATSILATIIMSAGVFVATGVKMDWFD